jgi:hypothetical protein
VQAEWRPAVSAPAAPSTEAPAAATNLVGAARATGTAQSHVRAATMVSRAAAAKVLQPKDPRLAAKQVLAAP